MEPRFVTVCEWSSFDLMSLCVCVCMCLSVTMANCGPADSYCSGKYHRIGFEYFSRCLYFCLRSELVKTQSQVIKLKMGVVEARMQEVAV